MAFNLKLSDMVPHHRRWTKAEDFRTVAFAHRKLSLTQQIFFCMWLDSRKQHSLDLKAGKRLNHVAVRMEDVSRNGRKG